MNRRILIADDDNSQLRMFREILRVGRHCDSPGNSMSFKIAMFADGKPLAKYFRMQFENGTRIPLCILDMMMPEMNGLETAEALRSVDPDVFIIIVTAHDISHDELIKSLKKDVYFMRKPVGNAELLPLVTSLLINWNNQQTLKEAYGEIDRTRCQLQAILDHSPTIMAQQDTQGRYKLINQRFKEVFGLSEEDVLGKTDADIFAPSTALTRAAQIQNVAESGKQAEFEEELMIGDTLRTYFTVRYPICGEKGCISEIGTMSADITRHKRAEKLLREKEDYSKAIMQAIQTGVMIIAPESFKIIDANPWACELLGYSREDITGRDFYEFLCPEWFANDPSQRTVSDEYVLLKKDKERIYTRRSIAKTRVNDQEYLVQSLLDITDIKNLMKKQEISIELAKILLNMINRGLERYTTLSEGLALFADAISVPCLKEGGDHYFVRNFANVAQGRDRKVLVSLKDQSGHEVGCVLRSIITDLIHHGILNKHGNISLEEAVSRLNDEICRSDIFRPGEFFTSVNAEICHETLDLKYVLTGHPRFFLIRGNEIKGLPEYGKPGRNIPIPINPGTSYSSGAYRLREGDRLIFYTDGLTDMPRTHKKKVISFDALEDIISDIIRHEPDMPVSDIMRGILTTISEISDVEVIPFLKNTSHDDITILCLEIENQNRYHERVLKMKNSDELDEALKDLYKNISEELKGRGYECSALAIRSVLAESIVNAWKHGNQKDPDKSVTVRWRYGNDFHFEVIDEGNGFDFHHVPDPRSEENKLKPSGRGICIIRAFSDMLDWKDEGRHLMLRLRKHSERTARERIRRIEKMMKLW